MCLNQQVTAGKIAKWMLIGWLLSIVLTIGLMCAAALFLLAIDIENQAVKFCTYIICFMAVFFGGWFAGHSIQYKKFLWGMLIGLFYYLTVCIAAAVWGQMPEGAFNIRIPAILLCLGSGMLGGMLG